MPGIRKNEDTGKYYSAILGNGYQCVGEYGKADTAHKASAGFPSAFKDKPTSVRRDDVKCGDLCDPTPDMFMTHQEIEQYFYTGEYPEHVQKIQESEIKKEKDEKEKNDVSVGNRIRI